MESNYQMTIILPEEMAELPVFVVQGSGAQRLVVNVNPADAGVVFGEKPEEKYLFLQDYGKYLKIAFDDILWIEAEGSYSVFHLKGKRKIMVSTHLAAVERQLSLSDFLRIHRSHIVNLKNVEALIGNCIKIGDKDLNIGREFRKRITDHFVFIKVHRGEKR